LLRYLKYVLFYVDRSNYWFLLIADEFYEVLEGFPRITELPDGVEALTYRVNLEKCKNYRAEEKILQKAGLKK
jgi:hypothetical protein